MLTLGTAQGVALARYRTPLTDPLRASHPAHRYDGMRACKIGHHAALRQLANRLVGIPHGCLKNRTLYDETTAWAQRISAAA